MDTIANLREQNEGKLPAFAWPGGYPIYYLLPDGATLCAECANGENGSEASETADGDWRIIAADVHWEGPDMPCEHCGKAIPSAYGNPDEEEADTPDFEQFELIRTWEDGDGNGFKLELFDTYQTRHGKSELAYRFYHRDRIIFADTGYGCSPMHAIDSDESVGGLLHFLACKPGDTDSEYFAKYNPAQLDFAVQHGENLWTYADALENGEDSE